MSSSRCRLGMTRQSLVRRGALRLVLKLAEHRRAPLRGRMVRGAVVFSSFHGVLRLVTRRLARRAWRRRLQRNAGTARFGEPNRDGLLGIPSAVLPLAN